jgi:ribosomal protein L37AE/L43A
MEQMLNVPYCPTCNTPVTEDPPGEEEAEQWWCDKCQRYVYFPTWRPSKSNALAEAVATMHGLNIALKRMELESLYQNSPTH